MSYKICIIGDGITALILTKVFLDLNVEISLINRNVNKKRFTSNRTVAISKSNFNFLKNQKILKYEKKNTWRINEIKLFDTKLNQFKKPILEFKNKNKEPLFYMIKNEFLFSELKKKIKKKYLLNFLKAEKLKKLLSFKKNNDYDLIINCDVNNKINKKFFFRRIKKNYKSVAYTTIINHKIFLNNIASQYFTKYGPIAFLPISSKKTSVVWSIKSSHKNDKKINKIWILEKIKNLFLKRNKIISFSKIQKFELSSSIPRDYYTNNILIFGDGSHQIHPLAGQGLNMTIRDIIKLRLIIKNRIDLGLELNELVLKDFKNKAKSYNFLFAKGNDFIEEFFSVKNKFFNLYSEKFFNKINKNLFVKKIFMKIADKGLTF